MQYWILIFLFTAVVSLPVPYTDRITLIESSTNQIILTTSKYGPVESLRIKVEIYDFYNERKFSVFDLTGPLLTLSRGRYTINFLKPNRWYGVMFSSENVIDGVTYLNIEEKLVRTLNFNSKTIDVGAEVFDHREGTNGHRWEDVSLTARWTDDITRQSVSDALINVELQCGEHSNKSSFLLKQSEPIAVKTITLDANYDVISNKTDETLTVAISPKECATICWATTLRATSPGHQFTFDNGTTCKPVETILATAKAKNYYEYEVNNGELVIRTQHPYDTDGGSAAVVQVSAFELSASNTTDMDQNQLHAQFKTVNGTEEYVLHNLLPNRYYGVYYEYVRLSPFRVYEQQRFMVESRKENGTSADHPLVHLQFGGNKYSVLDGKLDRSNLPSVRAVRDEKYQGYRMLVTVSSPCDEQTNETMFWLSDEQPSRKVNFDVPRVLCSRKKAFDFCRRDIMGDITPLCDTDICYTTHVLIDDNLFESKQRCAEVLDYYKTDPTAVAVLPGISAVTLLLSLLLLS